MVFKVDGQLFQPSDYEKEAVDHEGSSVVLAVNSGTGEISLVSSFGSVDFMTLSRLIEKSQKTMVKTAKSFFKESFGLKY